MFSVFLFEINGCKIQNDKGRSREKEVVSHYSFIYNIFLIALTIRKLVVINHIKFWMLIFAVIMIGTNQPYLTIGYLHEVTMKDFIINWHILSLFIQYIGKKITLLSLFWLFSSLVSLHFSRNSSLYYCFLVFVFSGSNPKIVWLGRLIAVGFLESGEVMIQLRRGNWL